LRSKILSGHGCTSSAQVEANAFVASIFLSGLRLYEAGHSSPALSLSLSINSEGFGLGEVFRRFGRAGMLAQGLEVRFLRAGHGVVAGKPSPWGLFGCYQPSGDRKLAASHEVVLIFTAIRAIAV
jgi:hypothetical protein